MTIIKTAAIAIVLTVLGAGSAAAAESMACCCKSKMAKMACFDKAKPAEAPTLGQTTAPAADPHNH